jgi:DNA-binding response OmpR family regulator
MGFAGHMKANVLLVASTDPSSNEAIAGAAAQTGHGLLYAADGREAFEILARSSEQVDLLIVDLDSGANRLPVLEAFRCSDSAPPLIALTQFEESDMEPIAYRHGALACLAKPFTSAELANLIAEICPSTSLAPAPSCDLWGHPYKRCRRTSGTRESFAQSHAG